MRLSRTSTLTALLAVTITVAATGTAQAVDPNAPARAVADQIADIAPEVEIAQSLELGDSLLASVDAGFLTIPTSPTDMVEIASLAEGAPDLAVSLPQLDGAEPAHLSDDGTVVYTSEDAASLAVQPLADGGTRFLSVLEDHSAPSAYDYVFEGAQLELLDDGSVSVTQDGVETARIDAPWALDAEGAAVPTRYVTKGDTLTQIVDHTSGDFSYPITADPHVFKWWGHQFQMNNSATNKLIKVINAGAGAAGVAAALSAAGVISSPGAIPAGIASAIGWFGGAALGLCNWNDRGVNINVTWNGWVTCTPR